jgi:hypothetical protein
VRPPPLQIWSNRELDLGGGHRSRGGGEGNGGGKADDGAGGGLAPVVVPYVEVRVGVLEEFITNDCR